MNHFLNTKGLTRNPLGIVALFISLIYGFACLVLSTSISNLRETQERIPLIWFIIVFPAITLAGFIFLVTRHHGKLYSPSDYGSAESFLKTLEGSRAFNPIEVVATPSSDGKMVEQGTVVQKNEIPNLNKGLFSDKTRSNLRLANQFFDRFLELYNNSLLREKVHALQFGVQAPEYFLLDCSFKESLLTARSVSRITFIIRATTDNNGIMTLIAIGKDIVEADPVTFASKVLLHLQDYYKRQSKEHSSEDSEDESKFDKQR